jgi:hypothetical protein
MTSKKRLIVVVLAIALVTIITTVLKSEAFWEHSEISRFMFDQRLEKLAIEGPGVTEFQVTLTGNSARTFKLSSSNEKFKVFILIESGWSTSSYIQRHLIRESWLKRVRNGEISNVGYVFVLGKPRSQLYDGYIDAIAQESELFNDVLVLDDFYDSYRNLSFKTQSGICWAAQNRNFDYLMKTDDDSAISLPKLLKKSELFPTHNFWLGNVVQFYPILDPGRPWTLVEAEIPQGSWREELIMTSGLGYLISRDVAQKLHVLLKGEEVIWPRIHLEDVNNGMLLYKRLKIYPTNLWDYGLGINWVCDCTHPSITIAHHCNFHLMSECERILTKTGKEF